ncbi:MAG: PAS domain S-box protein [Pseudomonadales bacterium]|nr:PAS domain S-box protein [Pseudomonadales bacterium]
MKINTYKQSLYVTLTIIIISTVTVVMSAHSAYSYVSTKNKIIEDMKQSSRLSIVSLQKNVAGFIASYAINEYDKLIFNKMEQRDNFAIIVEDYNMGKVLGEKSYISGKIRDTNGNIIEYDSKNNKQNKLLETCCYSDKDDIIALSGDKLGTIRIYISNASLNKELNEIIISTLINTIALSLSLIILLLTTIRFFILKPLSDIISVISRRDDSGIPIDLIPPHGSTEILALSNTMNSMICSIRDARVTLTEQHNALKAHEDQLKTLSMATEQSPASILICNPENIIEYANPQFEKTSGFTAQEVMGHSIEQLFQLSELDQNQVSALNTALASGEKWMGEMTPITKEGDSYSIRTSASSISSEDGAISHNIYVAEDITQLKLNEEILRNSQKMDAVGQLTGGIAHDFNNLLGIIMGNLELLKMAIGDQPKAVERIDKALAGTQRGAQLTRKLLNFSHQGHQGQVLTQINPFIESLQELIAKSVTAVIQVETHLADNLWPIKVEPGDLEDAILNLSLNARDAMPQGGLLVIETANKHLDAEYAKLNPSAQEGDFVMISVSDTGTGISKELRKKIFDPFFSTKEVGKGTGLGLAMVYGFVQRSSGHIQLYSEEGSGSSFHIYLPRAVGEREEKQHPEEKSGLPRGNETILVVDDEEAISDTAKGYLQLLGYKTLTANNGKEALEALSTTKGIDLIFSDVVMPGLDGFELSFAALKQQPTVKVLLTSGFTSKRMEFVNGERKIYHQLSKNLLGKPYNLNELALAVRRTLDKQT